MVNERIKMLLHVNTGLFTQEEFKGMLRRFATFRGNNDVIGEGDYLQITGTVQLGSGSTATKVSFTQINQS